MSKAKNKYQNLIPLPIHLNNSTNLYDILKSFIFSKSITRPIGIYVPFGKFVWIQQQDHNLFNHGCFGKGTLSRSEPTWYIRLKNSQSFAPEQKTVERRKKRKQQRLKKKKNTLVNDNNSGESSIVNNGNIEEEGDKGKEDDDSLTQKEILEWTQDMDFEKFHLDLFEAFFLIYAIDVIDIKDKSSNKSYTIEECWSIFSKDYSSNISSPYNEFSIKYAAYHYFRSQGWVPKDGLKFGVDFVLYQAGPMYHHAEFAVYIIPCPTLTTSYTIPVEQQQQQSPKYNWSNLLRLNRVCNQVKKTLILCYVSYPVINNGNDNNNNNNTWDISILNQISIKQIILKRWLPEKNRD
ncbi:hypothetical protein BJ944DRAFT_237196 [Cunninghamella echinulata]|nr:hypothetical protein BJ944DRAFT_237196 [Cunninghamella echinulata]